MPSKNKVWYRQRIVFGDESRFCLGMHDGRARVRRRRGVRRNPQFFVERHVHHTVGVMVWGATAYGSRSPLIFIRGNMNAQRYIHEVLEPHLLPYLDTLADPTFQQDNARPHVARVTIDFFQHNDVTLLPWPPRSPDLSPIERVWEMMGRRLLNLQRPPQTLEALREELVVAWNEIPQDDIDHLIRSMPRRISVVTNEFSSSSHNDNAGVPRESSVAEAAGKKLFRAKKPSLYCSHAWGAAAPTILSLLDAVQRRAVRLIDDSSLTDTGHIATTPLNEQRTVTVDWYTTICLPKVITELRKFNLERRIILHQDNASSHTAQKTRQYLTEENDHPPYSSDLSPNDFFTFPKIRNRLWGQRFQSPEEAVDAFKNAVLDLPANDWNKCFENWSERMQMCTNLRGEYFEKQ
ncbi:unnamed protein product [Acanthoscelides obtectus]|uniref:Tc1-like transposase DDE domain-containing protein n=1 Tax=Acanthoscelides obtectus TaxID=200917 RepID=A0A9P0MDH2_ACAOB|nr:unnamed protein product [Acanthoscelides obtectus]CAK1635801.1 Transposable element Tc3 transposase [Acanthoscelides obtectus]